MAKRQTPPAAPFDTMLVEPLLAARAKLEDRVAKGEELRGRRASSPQDSRQLQQDQQTWTDYNEALLRRLFTTAEIRDEYASRIPSPVMAYFSGGPEDSMQFARYDIEKLEVRLRNLRSIIERLELFPAAATAHSASPSQAPPVSARDFTHAFVVHGRDDSAKESVARFLQNLGVTPVVLHEQASGGRTIIEKLEHYGKVAFAVVLLTPDDEGRLAGSTEDFRPRARQNVLLELGYFVGLLGRKNVCALCRPPVEIPSDWDGVVWVPMDEHDGWKMKLAKELRAAGFTVDLSALL